MLYILSALLLFTPLARGAVQEWAVGGVLLSALATGTLLLFRLSWKQDTFWPATCLDRPIIALLILSAGSLFFSVHLYTSIIAAGQLLSLLLIYYSVVQVAQKPSGVLFLFYWITGISTLLCCIALVKRYEIPLFPWWNYTDLSYPETWLTATFANHNHLAGWLEMSMPLLLCSVLFNRHKKWLILQIPLLFLQVICLILTFSRGGYAGAIAAVGFILIWTLMYTKRRHGKIILLSCLTALILGGILLTVTPVVERMNTVISGGFETRGLLDRMLIWRGAMDMILDNWLTGTGPGTFALAFPGFQPPGFSHRYYFAHNDYLQFTAELGIFLPIIIIWAVIVVYRSGLQSMQHTDRLSRAMTLGSLAGITAILVHSAVDFNLHIPANALLFSVLLAFSVYNATESE
ncbi:MAG: O-antigen ligase domain-containing protein [Candidatus Electrothrix sp. MAN1_4]|nr:O-antigen ligase domain-containing protein [Candidatus Electrothrix sp. MAN1_4]